MLLLSLIKQFLDMGGKFAHICTVGGANLSPPTVQMGCENSPVDIGLIICMLPGQKSYQHFSRLSGGSSLGFRAGSLSARKHATNA